MKYFLALNKLNLGFATWQKLQSTFSDLEVAFSANATQLQQAGLTKKQAEAIQSFDENSLLETWRWLEAEENHIITFIDPRYPALLKEIHSPPLLLFMRGRLDLLALPQLTMVGSRQPTAIGKQNAKQFASYLAANGLMISSGLALGIDAASHEGALEHGYTLGVLGTGVDHIYPKQHRTLAERVIQQGLLVSEFSLGTEPRAENFPQRNRILSGLAMGVLVVEAALRSGSLITAKYALEQGREVFAIPGSIHNPLTKGCHHLIREGAKLVETAADILEELGGFLAHKPMPSSASASQSQAEDSHAALVLSALDDSSSTLDLILTRTGLKLDVASAILLQLELRGLVAHTASGYCRVHY